MEAQQAQLVIVTCKTSRKLNHTTGLTKLLKNLYSHSLLSDHSFTLTKLSITQQKLDNECHRIMDALKPAHMHQLLMDLLSPQAVEDIFEAIINQAFRSQMRLLISHPSDLFQIEVSYYLVPKNVKLFIHMPMAPIDSLLFLLKFHSFPLLFTDTHSLLPDFNNPLLAFSKGVHHQLHAELSPITPVGCQKAASFYLCEAKGILHCNLNVTCLGTLYDQDIDGILELCPLTIVPPKEVILQVQANQYLVYLNEAIIGLVE